MGRLSYQISKLILTYSNLNSVYFNGFSKRYRIRKELFIWTEFEKELQNSIKTKITKAHKYVEKRIGDIKENNNSLKK